MKNFKLSELTKSQKEKLLNYYKVESLDDLEVRPDGLIITKLSADGIGSFFEGAWNGVKNIANRFKPKLDFSNQSKATLAKYGDWKITKIFIQRQPIVGVLDKLINVMTFGAFQKAKKEFGYDKLFHLQLGVYVNKGKATTKILLEKNEVVDITVSKDWAPNKDQEYFEVRLPDKEYTLNDMVNLTRQQQGDKRFFEYDPFYNNCQFFVSYLLSSMHRYQQDARTFLFQDLTEFNKRLPYWFPNFARKVTDLGATVSNLRGKGSRRAAPVGVEANKKNVEADISKANQTSLDIIKKLQGGIGVQNYLTKEQREANRKAAEDRIAALGPGTKAVNNSRLNAERERYASINAMEMPKPKTKKTAKDYQAETRYLRDELARRDAKVAQEAAQKKAEEDAAAAAATAEEERKAEELVKEGRRQLQFAEDTKAYAEGRIDDIKDAAMRSRAQYESRNAENNATLRKAADDARNGFDRWYNNFIADNAIKATRQIPKVGDFIADVAEAYAADEDKDGDRWEQSARRFESGIVDHGPVVQDDYVGYGTSYRKVLKTKKFNK